MGMVWVPLPIRGSHVLGGPWNHTWINIIQGLVDFPVSYISLMVIPKSHPTKRRFFLTRSVVSKMFCFFHPGFFREMILFDNHIFQMGWFNHQLSWHFNVTQKFLKAQSRCFRGRWEGTHSTCRSGPKTASRVDFASTASRWFVNVQGEGGTWRIIPGIVSGERITPVYKPWKGRHLEGVPQPYFGDETYHHGY